MIFLIALITGALSALAFQPIGFAPLMVIAFAVLCELIARTGRMRSALLLGWAFGLGQFTVGLNWIATAFTYQAAMPAWLGWIAVVLLSFYLAVFQMLAVGLAWRFGRERPLALVLALAGGWIVAEYLRAVIFTGFAWNPVGVTLVDTPLLSASGLIGTYGVSGMVVALGGALWLVVRKQWKPALGLLAASILLALPLRFASITQSAKAQPRVRIVQPNIGQEDRWREGAAQAAEAKLLAMSGQPGIEPRLLLWPESAVTEPLDDDRPGAAGAITLQRANAAGAVGLNDVLAAGSVGLASRDGVHVSAARNSVFVLGPGGQEIGRYDKAHLVPYGEYLPMRPLLSAIGLSRLAPGDLDFDAGPGPRTIALPGFGRMGLQVCYEIIFSGDVVDRHDRPDFIFNPSNDSWFGRWGPPQHLAQARMRAAEEGIPVLRATPTGISAVVDANGKLLQSLAWHKAGVIDARLPPARAPTPFAMLGNLLPLLAALGLVIAAMWLSRRR